ncbi:MAG: hypothetical protein NXI16_13395 [Alphaproteobacteria bacterium]|nr:hypothetical protein [Alphaproteobacteria bacterium]
METVLIIGAGVAGSTLAALLAREGMPVHLIGSPPSRERFRIGETLPGFAAHWLDRHDLPGPLATDSPHWKIPGSVTAWEGPPMSKSYLGDPWGAHFRLDRPAFDGALYEAAIEAGALAHGTEATDVHATEAGWRVTTEDGMVRAGTDLVDATGRRAWATRGFREDRTEEDDPIAVWAVGQPTDRADRRTMIETGQAGWWYGCVLPDRRPLACLHTDKATASRLVRNPGAWLELLAETSLLPSVAPVADFAGAKTAATDARGVFRGPVIGPRWIAIGDAAVAFDPIAAHGISFALFGAERAKAWLTSAAPAEEAGKYEGFCADQWDAYSERKGVWRGDNSAA